MNKQLPFVSICTPTFNRRPFIPFLIKCFEHQNYPKELMEWIIIDDGTDPIQDLIQHVPQVKYYYYKDKMVLGKKRNLMHTKCKGDIIIYMDDDDYYPPTRVSHAVEMLQNNPAYLIAGASEMHIYFDSKNAIYRFGPYKPFHSTAATFAFRRNLLFQTKYDDNIALSEEQKFTNNYTIPLIQLDPLKSLLVCSHKHNSLNKERLLDNLEQTKGELSQYTVDDFISDPELKRFYTHDMNNLLSNYEHGNPALKTDMAEQLKAVEDRREKVLARLEVEKVRKEYEQKLEDKNRIISELLLKVKELINRLKSETAEK